MVMMLKVNKMEDEVLLRIELYEEKSKMLRKDTIKWLMVKLSKLSKR